MQANYAHSIIDKKIAANESAIRELRTRRNAHCPISRLPPELMSQIFMIVKGMFTGFSPQYFAFIGPRAGRWLNIAGTCRAWRDTVLRTPRLWNDIDISQITDIEWASTILTRSQGVPLRVICPDPRGKEAILKAVFKHITRIQELYLSADHRNLLELLNFDSASVVSTQMRSLYLNNLTTGSLATTQTLMPPLFKMTSSSLRDLSLIRIDLPPSVPLLPHLTRLKIRIESEVRSSSIPLVLSALRSTPALEDLVVEYYPSKFFSTDGPDDYPAAETPRLSELTVETNAINASLLIQHLRYPPSCCVRFHSDAEESDLRNLSAIVSHFASSDAAAQVDGVFVSHTRDGPFQLIATPIALGDAALSISRGVSEPIRAKSLELCTMLSSSNVKVFVIGGPSFDSVGWEEWMALFDRYSHVPEFVVFDLGADLFQALMMSGSNEHIPFPQLKLLKLEECHFDGSQAIPCLTSAVKGFLEQRKELKKPIGVLKLYRCIISAENAEKLAGSVSLDWDGHAWTSSDDEYTDDDEGIEDADGTEDTEDNGD